MTTVTQGKIGEDMACEYLKKQGYKIIERNFRIRGGEIDIVAIDGSTLVYVEVKTRTSHIFGSAIEAVTPWKLKFLVRTAKFYKNARKNLPQLERIDVLGIDLIDADPKYELVKNAYPI